MSKKLQEREDLIFTFLETADRLERRFDRTLSNTRGISFREYLLLRTLSRAHRRAATRVDLAAAVGLTPSAVTRALRPLEKLGCVDTQKSERDARRSLASLTTAGAELLADAQGAVNDLLAGLDLDLDDVDQQAMLSFLRGLGR